jgi:23S rRNA (uracil1939-C5)-methyltransferase
MLFFNDMRDVQVNIESMAYKGYGVGRTNGKVIFVPYSFKGETVRVEIIEEKKNYSVGRLKEMIEPSPWRKEPPCPYFGVCGGCQWQHIDYTLHGELKQEMLQDILRRLGGLNDIPPVHVIPSLQPYGYRARVQLKVKGKTLGYYRERSHEIIDIDHCSISHSLINVLIRLLREESSFFTRMEEIEINVSPEEGKGILVLHPLSSLSEWKKFGEKFFQIHPALKGIALVDKRGMKVAGDPFLHFTILVDRHGKENPLRFQASPLSFFQIHPEQNRRLIETVLEFSEVKKDERVLDLYTGIGNLALPLAMEAQEVVGIEENPLAIQDARLNAEKNGIKNSVFLRGRVREMLKDWKKERPDLIVIDPPRTGCKEVIEGIAGLKPTKIVYPSCEPTTLARDLRLFSEKGYHLSRLSLIDMFPQSYHMEVVALIKP